MNVPSENIVGSCEYTPVYLIQSPVVTLPESFVLPNSTTHTAPKPVSDNLKKFYESSGNLENSLLHNNDNVCKPRILKKHPIPVNGYKLSSFLTPKPKIQNNLEKKCTVLANNVVQKSSLTTSQNGVIDVSSILNMDRKIVKLKHLPSNIRNIPRPGPKTKPKEISLNVPNNINLHNSNTVKSNIISNSISPKPKLTSVQLLKLGETYHSLNQLSDGQMKIVNQALKIFSDPDKIPVEPTYDPVTNTRFIYKVVSPKDLTIVGKNKIVIKQKDSKKVLSPKTIEKLDDEIIDTQEQRSLLQAKVTRSGRMVKLPRQLVEEQELLLKEDDEKLHEDIDYCSQCCEEFKGLYNLNQDKEEAPSKIHSSLFNYLLAIIKNAPEADKASIFIQQLEQLIEKLKLLLPCLLKKIGGSQGKQCTINDDIGRLFNMIPGTYNLNMDALGCEKDADGFCTHNPKKIIPAVKPEVNNTQPDKVKEDELEECARIKPIFQWTVKRSWNPKQNNKVPKILTKKIRLTSENTEPPIELGTEDQNCINEMLEQSTDNSTTFKPPVVLDSQSTSDIINNVDIPTPMTNQTMLKGSHEQFYSAHFDIRSSPIKSTSSVFRKFQITPTTLPKCDVQIMKPLDNQELSNQTEEMNKEELPPEINDLSILQEMFKNDAEMPCSDKEVNDVCQVLNFDDAKNWELANNNEPPITNECTDSLIESALMHVTGDSTLDKTSDQIELTSNDSGQSVLNFLESLGNELAYPETEIRNNTIDFHLDLFSFHNS